MKRSAVFGPVLSNTLCSINHIGRGGNKKKKKKKKRIRSLNLENAPRA
jgi:hypothetical protein